VRVLGLLGAAALCGCGPQAGIWLKVGAPLNVPSQCDELDVSVTRGSDGASLLDTSYSLNASDPFPVTLTLSTDNRSDLGNPLTVNAQAKLAGNQVGSGSGTVTLDSRTLVPLTLVLSVP
jgi:hypothetical protein